MRKIVVKEWMSLDGVFDADNMDRWWMPYNSAERQEYIVDAMKGCDAYLLGRKTYEMLAPYWSAQKNDDNGPATWLNCVRKYVVSSSLKEAEWNNTTVIRGNVVEAIAELKRQARQGHHDRRQCDPRPIADGQRSHRRVPVPRPAHYRGKRKAFLQRRTAHHGPEASGEQDVESGSPSAYL